MTPFPREERDEPAVDGATFGDRVKRGWIWGTEDFKESMLDLLEKGIGGAAVRRGGNRTYAASDMMRDRSERRAERILSEARRHFGKTEAELSRPVRGDLSRAAVATRLFEETTVSQAWISEKLGMKSAPNVCQQIRQFRRTDKRKLSSKVKEWIKLNIF